MNTCRTCRHWDFHEANPEIDYMSQEDCIGVRQCMRVKLLSDCTDFIWGEDDFDDLYALKPEFEDELAFAQDASGYSARFLTKPDFGCVQWKEESK